MNNARPDLALERTLLALERELIDATDEEVLAAARDLGMHPEMKWSAAYFGVTVLATPRLGIVAEDEPTIGPARWRRPGDGPPSG